MTRTTVALAYGIAAARLTSDGVSWEKDREELRLFEGTAFWIDAVTRQGFRDSGRRLLQDHAPSRNTLVCFVGE